MDALCSEIPHLNTHSGILLLSRRVHRRGQLRGVLYYEGYRGPQLDFTSLGDFDLGVAITDRGGTVRARWEEPVSGVNIDIAEFRGRDRGVEGACHRGDRLRHGACFLFYFP